MALGPAAPTRLPLPADPPTDAELVRRFAAGRDDEAFAAIVRRHGPMVLGVCRRALPRVHDAEEAFQMTFLALVRKAGSLARPDRLAAWLHGAAARAALKVRAAAARQAVLAERAAAAPAPGVEAAGSGDELRAALDEEMLALPEKYRVPLVLCYLEGLTNEAAARRLGWPAGSMSYRLARGRDLLRKRLRKRTRMLLAPIPFTAWLSSQASAAALPDRLAEAVADQTRAERKRSAPPPVVLGKPAWLAVAALVAVILMGGLGFAAFTPVSAGPPPAATPDEEPPPPGTLPGPHKHCP